MSIASTITRMCKQAAVYWGSPQVDGYGGYIFAAPVEIMCRWEEKSQLIRLDDGNEISSRAIVYVLQDMDLEGYLYLGTLDSLYDNTESSAGALSDPRESGAYTIKKIEKSPVLGSTTEFYRKVWLTPLLT